ncbi:hypothetical protein DFQ10_10761 [Winogradskyella eximia]|uniref:DUF2911 family protein n=1 Tax=Winogradskyella eximia TaxID=262006 RepID=A0A3D9H038_9FLAO|nr:DUF2911 domain-containing protein [Winogradskyella eximia]RED42877.1 hypothetical protein DFQ10_10761 [Winogradskyella eximia]|tara:strand:- start:29290 stop:30135 length:846 start_codon:yes stop_codon:yes gene_type:complete
MKKLLLFTFALTLMFSVDAQIKTPQPSPFSKVEQVVGLTDVTLEYSRPSMNGRTIFGDLVPYGKLWRAGANKNTMITFSDEVVIAGNTLKAGAYAIFITPSEKSWEVIFYSDTNNWGAPKTIDAAKVAAKVKIETMQLPMKVETFTITFDNLTSGSAELGFIWENTMANLKFEVPTAKTVTASIEKVMAGPSANDYYAAAVYNLSEGKDLEQAKDWMEKAMSMTKDPKFYQLRKQSLIYAALGDKKKAISTAKESLAKAEKAENADYIKMNKDSLKEWGAK